MGRLCLLYALIDSFLSLFLYDSLSYDLCIHDFYLFNGMPEKRSITDERAALEQCLIEVESNGLENGQRKFVSGMEVPNLGDVSLFGTIRAIQGLPAHDEIIEKRGGILEQWYERMRVAVERKSD